MPKLAWGARGREFESRHADHFFLIKSKDHASQGCDPFSITGLPPQIAPLIAPLFWFATRHQVKKAW